MNFSHYKKLLFLAVAFLLTQALSAQYTVKGTVYDSSRTYPLEAVSVMTSSGKFTTTSAAGAYTINVGEKDSIWFSYLGKPTIKFPVLKINDVNQFDIALKVPINVLKGVTVRPRNYREDSLQFRNDYRKGFDFQRPNVETLTSIGPNGAGIDINELIRVFQFRKNKSMALFQKRLLRQEQDRFIDHRFNKALVLRLTGLTGEEQELFMNMFRPSYEFSLYTSDYDFQEYIKKCFDLYKSRKGL